MGYNLSEVEQIITDLDEKRRAQRDAANVADAAEEDTTEPATDTEEPELDTAAVENDPRPPTRIPRWSQRPTRPRRPRPRRA